MNKDNFEALNAVLDLMYNDAVKALTSSSTPSKVAISKVQQYIGAVKLAKSIESQKHCCFCKERLKNIADENNAMPLADDVCCSLCNETLVIPARIFNSRMEGMNNGHL